MGVRLVLASVWAAAWSASVSAGVVVPPALRIEAEVRQVLQAPAELPMHMPTDVAVDAAGRVYVADGTNDRIVCFAPAGQVDGIITEGQGRTLKQPVGVSVDAQGRVWIADTGNGRVLIIASNGQSTESVSLPVPSGADRTDPTDVAVTPDGTRAYVVDNDNHRLVVRDNATGQWTVLGGKGRGLGRFQWPFMVCVGAEGYVYVAEAINARVQRITADDRWAGAIGRWGVEAGRLYRPKGVTADRKGTLYVSDSTLGVIQAFGARGALEGVLTDGTGVPLRFDHPMGMCFDGDGRLFVVELGADRVAVMTIRTAAPVEKKLNRNEQEGRP